MPPPKRPPREVQRKLTALRAVARAPIVLAPEAEQRARAEIRARIVEIDAITRQLVGNRLSKEIKEQKEAEAEAQVEARITRRLEDLEKRYNIGEVDARAISLAQNGDRNATEAIFKQYEKLIRGVARTYNIPRHDLEDVVGELNIYVMTSVIPTFNPRKGKSFKNFMRECLKRKMISLLKTETRQMRKNPHGSDRSLDYAEEGERPLGETMAVGAHDSEIHRIEQMMPNGWFETFLLSNSPNARLERDVIIARSCWKVHEGDVPTYAEVARILGLKDSKKVDNALTRFRKKLGIRGITSTV